MSLARYIPRWAQRGAILDRAKKSDGSCEVSSSAAAKRKKRKKKQSEAEELVDAKEWIKLIRRCRSIKECKDLHGQIAHFRSSPQVSNALIEMYGKCGGVSEAMSVFHSLKDLKNSFSFRFALRACIDNGCLEQAKLVMQQMPKEEQDGISLSAVVSALAAAGRIEEARAAFDGVADPEPFLWNSMLACYAQNGHLREARDMFERMPRRDAASYHTILGASADSSWVSYAAEVYRRMPAWTLGAMNRMVLGFAKSGQIEEAEFIFEGMEVKGFPASLAMLGAFARFGKVEEARKVLGEIGNNNVAASNTMLQALCGNVSCFEEAKRMFHQEMPQRDALSWTTLIKCYAERGELDEAAAVLQRMPHWDADAVRYAAQGENGVD